MGRQWQNSRCKQRLCLLQINGGPSDWHEASRRNLKTLDGITDSLLMRNFREPLALLDVVLERTHGLVHIPLHERTTPCWGY